MRQTKRTMVVSFEKLFLSRLESRMQLHTDQNAREISRATADRSGLRSSQRNKNYQAFSSISQLSGQILGASLIASLFSAPLDGLLFSVARTTNMSDYETLSRYPMVPAVSDNTM